MVGVGGVDRVVDGRVLVGWLPGWLGGWMAAWLFGVHYRGFEIIAKRHNLQ